MYKISCNVIHSFKTVNIYIKCFDIYANSRVCSYYKQNDLWTEERKLGHIDFTLGFVSFVILISDMTKQ